MLGPEERFDTVLYIDVLEHIEDDQTEVARVRSI
jgi:2-polyprenyl-3-methyl-5-hydroxy-6-metoxy-1,4-benzoquinol methylase